MKPIARTAQAALVASALTAAVSGYAMADQASLDAIMEECTAKSRLGAEGCACLVKAAAEELNDNQQALMLAGLRRDDAAMAELRPKISEAEGKATVAFMSNTPGRCKGQ
ncbi:hypothetical protein ACKTEK_14070 [Tepidamorphus sp. 3E244]|uniref:hypothetical protein n=1 Tax=Tepidamorphus sp. 3E244 TaxID=3385498 RepID=UPI0038FC7F8C